MQFILFEELKLLKFQSILNEISEEDNYIVDEIEQMAISEISSYLGSKYDTNTIFSRIGTDRHPLIKRITLDLMIYLLFQRVTSKNIPDYILEKYKDNITFLTQLAKGILNIQDLPKLDPNLEKTTFIKWNSEIKFMDSDIN